MTTTNITPAQLPAGVWQVDPANSELAFSSRGVFGLVPVHGKFKAFDGTLTISEDGARGELSIQASTLDTGNAKRDDHLRSPDFFDVNAYPVVSFALTDIEVLAEGKLAISGTLKIRETGLPLRIKADAQTTDPGSLSLSTKLDVDRTAAGIGWSKMGVIKGKAHLSVNVTLIRQS
jgi:polyisoprenoid-binding protein YceI